MIYKLNIYILYDDHMLNSLVFVKFIITDNQICKTSLNPALGSRQYHVDVIYNSAMVVYNLYHFYSVLCNMFVNNSMYEINVHIWDNFIICTNMLFNNMNMKIV